MPISLPDLRTAVATYLNTSVTSTVTTVIPDTPGTMNPGEFGTFNVQVRNAPAPDGIRLINVKHHLTIAPANRGLLVVPAAPPARATTDPNDPPLVPGTLVSNMFIFPVDSSLDVGDFDAINGLRVKALALGDVTISGHVHADPDDNDLFPHGENNPNFDRLFAVV